MHAHQLPQPHISQVGSSDGYQSLVETVARKARDETGMSLDMVNETLWSAPCSRHGGFIYLSFPLSPP